MTQTEKTKFEIACDCAERAVKKTRNNTELLELIKTARETGGKSQTAAATTYTLVRKSGFRREYKAVETLFRQITDDQKMRDVLVDAPLAIANEATRYCNWEAEGKNRYEKTLKLEREWQAELLSEEKWKR